MSASEKFILCLIIISCVFQVTIEKRGQLATEVEFELKKYAIAVESQAEQDVLKTMVVIYSLTKDFEENGDNADRSRIEMYTLEAISDIEALSTELRKCVSEYIDMVNSNKLTRMNRMNLLKFRRLIKNKIDRCIQISQSEAQQRTKQHKKNLYGLAQQASPSFKKIDVKDMSDESIKNVADELIKRSSEFEKTLVAILDEITTQLATEANAFKKLVNAKVKEDIENIKIKYLSKIRQDAHEIQNCIWIMREEIEKEKGLNKLVSPSEVVAYQKNFETRLEECRRDRIRQIKVYKENFTKESIDEISKQTTTDQDFSKNLNSLKNREPRNSSRFF